MQVSCPTIPCPLHSLICPFYLSPLVACLAFGLLAALAVPMRRAGRPQPAHERRGRCLRYDDARQTSVFTGNVVITKGTIVIRGAQGRGGAAKGRAQRLRQPQRWSRTCRWRCTATAGEVVGLLGPNGAGKTTSFYMIVGLVRCADCCVPTRAKSTSTASPSTHMPIHRRARLGLGYLPQEASIFRKLTWSRTCARCWNCSTTPRASR
jgi:hypothetical protein